MSGLVDLKVEGLSNLEAQLLELGAELGVKTLSRAARKSFAVVLETARALVRVDTGELRDSIRIGSATAGAGETVAAAGLFIGKAPAVAKGTTPSKAYQAEGARHFPAARRWHFVERGTSHSEAHPFLRPALDRNAQRVLDDLKVELEKSIAAAVRRKASGK